MVNVPKEHFMGSTSLPARLRAAGTLCDVGSKEDFSYRDAQTD